MSEVTVLIAARNAASTLSSTLKSVARSRGVDWRCLVVDDHSSDDTLCIADAFSSQDSRFEVVSLGVSHRGVVDARNYGLSHIQSPFVAILDADDIMHRDRLAIQLDKMKKQSLDVVGCHVRYFPRREVLQGRLEYEAWLNSILTSEHIREAEFVEMPLGHPTLMFRREFLDSISSAKSSEGLSTAYHSKDWPEDWDLLLRCFQHKARMAVVPRVLHAWRLRSDSLSQISETYSVDAFMKCRAHYLQAKYDLKEYILWGFGGTGRALHKSLAQHGCHPIKIVELHPGRLGQRIHGADVISPEQLSDELIAKRLVDTSFPPALFSVAGQSARNHLRNMTDELGLEIGRDVICCA